MIDTRTVRVHRFAAPGFSAVGATHVGVVRERNEDRLAVDPASRAVAVADGMGGHERGEEAARLAVEAAVAAAAGPDDVAAVRAAVAAAQAAVAPIVAAHGAARRPPGCTLVVARLAPGGRHAAVAWVGDSRAYLVHRGAVRRLTRDHATPAGHLTRCVGGGCWAGDDGEAAAVDLPEGAQILLCTDGLHGVLADETIATVVAAAGSRDAAVRALLAEATSGRRGSRASTDNVTAVFVRGS